MNKQDIAEYPVLARLCDNNSVDIGGYEKDLKDLLDSNEINDLVLSMLRKSINKAKSSGEDYSFAANHIELYDDEFKSITYVLSSSSTSTVSEHSSILNFPYDTLFGINSDISETCKFFSFETESLDLFKSNTPLKYVGSQTIGNKDVLKIKAGKFAYQFLDLRNVIRISLKKEISPIVWLFDAETMLSTKSFATNPMASRLEYAIKLMDEFPVSENLVHLQNMVGKSIYHFVRWGAIKALINHDFETGVISLKQSLKDPHLHIRKAAERTLASFKAHNLI